MANHYIVTCKSANQLHDDLGELSRSVNVVQHEITCDGVATDGDLVLFYDKTGGDGIIHVGVIPQWRILSIFERSSIIRNGDE